MNDIQEIKERNQRVELDKAWEISLTRRSIIAGVTYIVATVWLVVIENEKPFLNALVPFGGYIFSTWSLPLVRGWWIAKQNHDS
jgi:hypothetical protein